MAKNTPLTAKELFLAKEMLQRGYSTQSIADEFDRSENSIYRFREGMRGLVLDKDMNWKVIVLPDMRLRSPQKEVMDLRTQLTAALFAAKKLEKNMAFLNTLKR